MFSIFILLEGGIKLLDAVIYNEYKNKLKISFEYIFNNNNVDLIDYKYCLGLLFKSIYVISEDLVNEIKIIFKDIQININDIPQEWIDILDIDHNETYLYIFSEIKKDIDNNNMISNNTKFKIMVMLNKIGDKRYPFVILSEEEKGAYRL